LADLHILVKRGQKRRDRGKGKEGGEKKFAGMVGSIR